MSGFGPVLGTVVARRDRGLTHRHRFVRKQSDPYSPANIVASPRGSSDGIPRARRRAGPFHKP